MTTEIMLYNTLKREKSVFEPIDTENIGVYVCGPTVYDFAHIGNARPVIVFDILNRFLREVYGASHVTFVRNITDVDDKINARALRDYPDLPLNEAISHVTEKTIAQYHADIGALECLAPDHEPRATQFVDDMATMAQNLIDKGFAYIAKGDQGREVLFDTEAMPTYGKLSNRKLDEQMAGARVAVENHKKNAGDFVLWKESSATAPGWDADYTANGETQKIKGRPGWHIECSVMAKAYLGEVFDIHGGGLDLIFPHHENEIAQSCCAHETDHMARYWMHNGFLQLEGRKMSKSEGNFITISELLNTNKFGGRKWAGQVLKLAMLMTHYREPIDFSIKRLEEAEAIWKKWPIVELKDGKVSSQVMDALSDDLNTVTAVQAIQKLAMNAGSSEAAAQEFAASAALLGLLPKSAETSDLDVAKIDELVSSRLGCLKEKNWAKADQIRDELGELGVLLKDGKDPDSGERITNWEVKR
ncbi:MULTISPECIES: cysteine--tRNA ligase [unclassified Lentilitoribacter]|uniref:cysteine--tRNA ligase n=1 Tax=unclassified Lentilitoribacter TaxID=2647570 RepID=UPI0013A70581|nr:cysteine--tRNA ligase [Lentilitoribacter sp. Alg239-R112]